VHVRGLLSRSLIGIALLCGAALAVVGGVALRGPGLVAVCVAGAMAGCVAAGVARESVGPHPRSVTETALNAAAVTVGALLVLSGTALLAGGAVAVLGIALAGAGWGIARWAQGLRAALPPAPAAQELSTAALVEEWVRTGAALQGQVEPGLRQALAVRRGQLLDELERRDPAGFTRWLAAGPLGSTDPAGYLRSEPPRADPSAAPEAA
jgi:hypothetical protein